MNNHLGNAQLPGEKVVADTRDSQAILEAICTEEVSNRL